MAMVITVLLDGETKMACSAFHLEHELAAVFCVNDLLFPWLVDIAIRNLSSQITQHQKAPMSTSQPPHPFPTSNTPIIRVINW